MRMRSISIVAILIVLIVAMSGCTSTGTPTPAATATPAPSQAATSGYPMTVTDNFDRTATLNQEPQRIVSLSPANTEMLFALGLGGKIVGNTDFDDYPAEAKNITHVSGYSTVSYEKIMMVSPDVIFADDITGEETVTSLREKGFQVVELKNNNMSNVINNIELMGKVTNTESNATALVADINARISNISSKTAGLNESQKPTVLLLTGYVPESGIWVFGSNTYGDELIKLDGGINVAGNVSEYSEMSKEAIIKADPDYIIVPVDGLMTTEANYNALKNGTEAWAKDLKAVKNGRVIMVDGSLMFRPGPRLPDAAVVIARAIQPELFPVTS